MSKVVLITYLDRNIVRNNNNQTWLLIPFSGIYNGHKIKAIKLYVVNKNFQVLDKVPCRIKFNVTGLANNKITGKLETLMYFQGLMNE